jgi:D-beta-D-heptose 7-phosphate kinase/D-beta-D-heptose 1-phosphate adenosyltransferase
LSEWLSAGRAREIVRRFTATPVLIVGDIMLDQFIVGRVDRISPEAPVPIVRFDHETHRVGGAANVAHNVRALGGRAQLAGVVGRDDEARLVRSELLALGIGHESVLEHPDRRTTKKVRVVTTRNLQVARIDYEQDEEMAPAVVESLASAVERLTADAGAVVVSDYLKGAITGRLMECIARNARRHEVPVLVDPKIPHLEYYAGASIITPNHYEAEAATHLRIRTNDDARAAARVFRDRAKCEAIVLTRGEHGMCVLGRVDEAALPAAAREVADVTGAGDTVIGTLALAVAAGATLIEAAVLANAAAGVTVGRFGPSTLTQQELLKALDEQRAMGNQSIGD